MKKSYKPEEKAKIVLEVMRGESTLNEIATKNNLHPNMVSRWKIQAVKNLPVVFEGESSKIRQQAKESEKEKEELYNQIGKLTTQLAWLKKKSNVELL